jgi:hypothetical protein
MEFPIGKFARGANKMVKGIFWSSKLLETLEMRTQENPLPRKRSSAGNIHTWMMEGDCFLASAQVCTCTVDCLRYVNMRPWSVYRSSNSEYC